MPEWAGLPAPCGSRRSAAVNGRSRPKGRERASREAIDGKNGVIS